MSLSLIQNSCDMTGMEKKETTLTENAMVSSSPCAGAIFNPRPKVPKPKLPFLITMTQKKSESTKKFIC